MSQHAMREPVRKRTSRRRSFAALLATAALAVAGIAALPADATTTIEPTPEVGANPGDPGVVRDDTLTLKVDRGALHYYKSGSNATNRNNATYTALPLGGILSGMMALNALGRACVGDQAGGLSPRTTVEVTGPGGVVVPGGTSPARDIRYLVGDGKPLNPQPAPAAGNYVGDFPTGGPVPGFSVPINLAGKPAGIYTVKTTNYNTTKQDIAPLFGSYVPGPCVIGVPDASGKGVIPGPVVSTIQFEYRPWQETFNDLLGHGKVSMNLTPKEFQATVDGSRSGIYSGDVSNQMKIYSSPTALLLPSDPAACLADPSTCLPSGFQECTGQPGCVPRIVGINRAGSIATDGSTIQGLFDLETRAFIAFVTVDGKTRHLLSLGTELDALYGQVLTKAVELGAQTGIDVMRVLTTSVKITGGGKVTTVSLLNGLQIDPTEMPGGLTITSGITELDTNELGAALGGGVLPTVQAGVIINIGAGTASTAVTGCKPLYKVKGTDLVPDIPKPGVLGALVGGPVRNVYASFPYAGAQTLALLGVDTSAGEPNGLPVWVNPIPSGVNAAATKNIDFVGTVAGDTVLDTATDLLGTCLYLGGFIGAGVAVLNNPLPVGLKDIFDPLSYPNPTVAPIVDAVSETLDEVVNSAATNPAVADLLGQILAVVPEDTLPTP